MENIEETMREDRKNEMPELKNCPFCGGKPELRVNNFDHYQTGWIECPNCSVKTKDHGGKELTIAAWNTRHYPELEPIREALEACAKNNYGFQAIPNEVTTIARKALEILNRLK